MGSYMVTSYVVNGDTLYAELQTTNGRKAINKLGVSGFLILIERDSPNQVGITTWYFRNGLKYTFSKEVIVERTDYKYLLTPVKEKGYAPSVYESWVGRPDGDFYERTVGTGSLFIPLIDSPTAPAPSSPPTVVITAKSNGRIN